jgi:prepilin-type N-terminal cleavage/methylation domain-containing protein
MKTTRNKSHSGFTLIELSVVAAILMMLATIALPSFQATVSNAQVSAVQSQLGRMRTACDFYAFQHCEQIPGHDDATGLWSEQTLLNQLQLASNDDGITAPGIRVLVDCMKKLGEVVVVAPDSPQSGMGHAITINESLRLEKSDIAWSEAVICCQLKRPSTWNKSRSKKPS